MKTRFARLIRSTVAGSIRLAIALIMSVGALAVPALAVHADAINKHAEQQAIATAFAVPKKADDPEEKSWQRLRTALDEVSGQRDCHASRLFWYTDFDQAKAAAKREGKPILSLRLLGKLTDEYSCANSRFFRTTRSRGCIGEALLGRGNVARPPLCIA